ncbi:MAG: adenylyl-sulfate kinase [Fibrobacteres bacterium]|nr:adenylyl-sulfate kinase [Fibrobacterota bacterium]
MIRERMNIVVTGHVDHGKSTVVGRLLADTGSLPEGKLEQVRLMCERNARPFEYAFLLDALKDEQSQGITIDSARCFFRTKAREYVIIDAPGHIEFLKNMVSGAARAEAALLVIDAKEGVRENSRRHGYLLSMLGISQIAVIVNKMDIVDYSKERFDSIVEEYSAFLKKLKVHPAAFIPVSALHGVNIAKTSEQTNWYNGNTVLQQLDSFVKAENRENKPFRMPVQDVYKFTANGDDRRIVAGTIESGSITEGKEVIFLPSGKTSKIRRVETFPVRKCTNAYAGQAVGFTLEEEIYIKPGEIMCIRGEEPPRFGRSIEANIFWMGRNPLEKGKKYYLKLGSAKVETQVEQIHSVLDASTLGTDANSNVKRHEVAKVTFKLRHSIAFDKVSDLESTGRFVIVDNYEIAGGGIILQKGAEEEQNECISADEKKRRIVVVNSVDPEQSKKMLLALEEKLLKSGYEPVMIDMVSFPDSLSHEVISDEVMEKVKEATDFVI